jgi:hypothetical protein
MSIPVSPFYARPGNEDNSHLLVLRVAEVLAKRYRTSTMQVFNRWQELNSPEQLEGLVDAYGVDAVDEIDWDLFVVLLATLALLFADAVRAGGAATARGISDVTGEAFSFQMSPEQIEEANAASAEGIQRITDATRAGAAALLALLLADDLPTKEVAEEWSGGLGLTKRQVASLDKFEEGLEETGLVTGDEKDSMVDKFALALLLDRAGVISDDQVWKAANIGREFALGTAVGIGLLSPKTVKIWNTAGDERVCPICLSLSGQRRLIGEAFVAPYNGQIIPYPPVHVQCVYRCFITWQ